jgi:hypothetical protein
MSALFAAGRALGVVLAEVADLTTKVLKMMLPSKLGVTALVLLVLTGTGLICNGSGAVGEGQQGNTEALKQAQILPALAPAPPKRAHAMSDTGYPDTHAPLAG